MTALLLAGVASAALPEAAQQKAWRNAKKSVNQKVIAARPEIKSAKLIVSGNKKLSLEADGTVTLSNSSAMLAKIFPFSSYTDKSNGKTDWVFLTPKNCKIRRDGNKIVWELYKVK